MEAVDLNRLMIVNWQWTPKSQPSHPQNTIYVKNEITCRTADLNDFYESLYV